MNRRIFSLFGRVALLALLGLILLPVTAFAQRTWVVRRPQRNRVVIYQPRPYGIYQRRPVYSYRYNTYRYNEPHYATRYYSNGYSQPYYANQYYSYRYSQPYFANRYGYAWSNPSYRYRYDGYQPRYRRNRSRVGIWLR
jgi:hypothetical protein